MLYTILIVFFVINAIFWGLYPHSAHCSIASTLGMTTCPSHWIHISIGVVSFLIAVVIAQRHMFF